MLGRLIKIAITFVAVAPVWGADYRGAATAWPVYANGTYAANYPANQGASPAYYVARPVAVAGYGVQPQGTMYVPVRAAYANPTYFAAYGRSPVMYRPVSTAGYAPSGGYYAPVAANYAPVTANYAPVNSYAVTPAGLSSSGSEAAAYFGQPTTLNYVPPRYAYRTTYAPVPVYTYRPVTAYQPVAGQPVTCMQASTCMSCQPQRTRCGSWWNPFTWFGHGRSCGTSACGAAPTTTYCGTAACGQPYYPVQPVQPVVPVIPSVPATSVPVNPIPALPRGFLPGQTTTIPPPPTLPPGTRTIVTPAETRPSLSPGVTTPGVVVPQPNFTPLPGSTIPTQPAVPATPGGSFPTAPTQPGGFVPGAFGTGTNYAPPADPYNAVMTPAARSEVSRASRQDDGVIRAPDMPRLLPPSVQTVPDLDAPVTPRPVNAAPQLLDPRDKTARRDPRWAVVPALWPTKVAGAGQGRERLVRETKAYEAKGLERSPYVSAQASSHEYDDGGWKTAAF